jgi:hypothetical protein
LHFPLRESSLWFLMTDTHEHHVMHLVRVDPDCDESVKLLIEDVL